MNSANAFGFLVLGSVMNLVPSLAPSASAASDLWLHFMGFVVGGIGGCYVAREGIIRVPTLVGAINTRVLQPVFAKARGTSQQVSERVRATV